MLGRLLVRAGVCDRFVLPTSEVTVDERHLATGQDPPLLDSGGQLGIPISTRLATSGERLQDARVRRRQAVRRRFTAKGAADVADEVHVEGRRHHHRQGEQALSVLDGEDLSDAPAHGEADHMGALDPVAVEHGDRVLGEIGDCIRMLPKVATSRATSVAVVVSDDEAAARYEHREELVRPSHSRGVGAHDEQRRGPSRIPKALGPELELAGADELACHCESPSPADWTISIMEVPLGTRAVAYSQR